MKEKILDIGLFNNWKGYIGLYLNKKEIRILKKSVPNCENMTIKQIYNSL